MRDSSEDKSPMLLHSKNPFLLPSDSPGTENAWALIWKKSLLNCFESYEGMLFPNPPHKQIIQEDGEHFANG